MGNNEATIRDHIKKMDRPSVWATQVEVHTTSSFFQVPVYILCYRRVAFGGVANLGVWWDHVTKRRRHFVGQKRNPEKLQRCLQAVVPLVAQVATVRKRE